jgi:hypothetical protein
MRTLKNPTHFSNTARFARGIAISSLAPERFRSYEVEARARYDRRSRGNFGDRERSSRIAGAQDGTCRAQARASREGSMPAGGVEICPTGIAVAALGLKASSEQVGGPGPFRRGLAGDPAKRVERTSAPAVAQRHHGGSEI